MYADRMTGSMERAIHETNRRRNLQIAYNEAHNITPQSIIKSGARCIESEQGCRREGGKYLTTRGIKRLTRAQAKDLIMSLEAEMKEAARSLEFEQAAELRDLIHDIKKRKKIK